MIRSSFKGAAAHLMASTGLDRVLGAWSGAASLPVVVGYHRVVEDFDSSSRSSIPSMLISRRMLEQHLDSLARQYKLVPLEEAGALMYAGGDRAVAAVTFDDGYRDFYEIAFPLLQRKGIPAALFVVTGLMDTDRPQDHDKLYFLLSRRFGNPAFDSGSFSRFLQLLGMPLTVAAHSPYEASRALLEGLTQEQLRTVISALEEATGICTEEMEEFAPMTWEMVESVHRAGVTIGSHTKSHVLMTNEPPARLAEEAATSRYELECRLRSTVQHFAYPSGCFDDESVASVARSGYRFAYTVCRHRSQLYPLLTVPRTLLWERSSLNGEGRFDEQVLRCQVRGAFEFVNGCRQRHRARQGKTYVQ